MLTFDEDNGARVFFYPSKRWQQLRGVRWYSYNRIYTWILLDVIFAAHSRSLTDLFHEPDWLLCTRDTFSCAPLHLHAWLVGHQLNYCTSAGRALVVLVVVFFSLVCDWSWEMSGTVAIHSIPFQGKKPVLSMQQLSAVSVAPVIYHQSASDPILAFAGTQNMPCLPPRSIKTLYILLLTTARQLDYRPQFQFGRISSIYIHTRLRK